MAKKKQIFVIGLDDFNLSLLRHLPEAETCDFLPAVKFNEMRGVDRLSIRDLIHKSCERIDEAGRIDGIITYFDFPASLMVPIIAEKYGLPGTSVESVLKCEHKYWSRREQKKVIPKAIPDFRAFDPFADDAWEHIGFAPPFWIKPIKSYHSYLAYKITDQDAFEEAIKEVRQHIQYIAEPFCELLKDCGVPESISSMKETMFAETQISGHQATVEGYVHDYQVMVYGIIDTMKAKGYPSLASYLYPSSHPHEVQYRMADLARRVVEQLGLNNTAFNIEFFYNEQENKIYLLEINPRMSQSHAYMFEKVHGLSHHHVIINLALGNRPKPLKFDGEYHIAGHFMLREFESGVVTRVPGEDEIEGLGKIYPDLTIKVNVKEGMHLDDMEEHHIDSYSYVLADIYLAADNHKELMQKYDDVVSRLSFQTGR